MKDRRVRKGCRLFLSHSFLRCPMMRRQASARKYMKVQSWRNRINTLPQMNASTLIAVFKALSVRQRETASTSHTPNSRSSLTRPSVERVSDLYLTVQVPSLVVNWTSWTHPQDGGAIDFWPYATHCLSGAMRNYSWYCICGRPAERLQGGDCASDFLARAEISPLYCTHYITCPELRKKPKNYGKPISRVKNL